MPMYDYVCEAGHVFEEINSVNKRHATSCECGSAATMHILNAPVIDPRMGVDPDFPTAAAQWDRKQRRKSTGQMKDANQTRFGTHNDVERDAHTLRKGLEA